MAAFGTDVFNLTSTVGVRAGGVYTENVAFNTLTSPGSAFPISQKLAQSDTIGLFFIPTPGRLYRYSIDFGQFDSGGASGNSAALVMVLEDGLGNTYQSGLTIGGSAGNPNRLTDITALAGTIGQIDYTSAAVAFLRLRVTTAANTPISAAASIKGMAVMQKN